MKEYTVKVFANGDKLWYQNGELHSEDGPAIEMSNGDKTWWVNGKRHREDGPAIECINGTKEWWVNGKQYIEKEFNERNFFKEYTIKELELLLDHRIKIVNNH